MFRKIVLSCLFFISFAPAYAQECNPPYEMVTRLHKPEPGAYTVWNAVYGKVEYDETFASVLPVEDGGVLAVGQRQSLVTGILDIVFVNFDRLGREIDEHVFSLSGMERVVKILKHPAGGYAVLANIRRDGRAQFWLGFFGDDFKLRSQRVFSDERFDLLASDFIPSVNSGWVISVSSFRFFGEGEGRTKIEKGQVYLLDASGKKLKERSYSPGGDNHISSLSVVKSNGKSVGYIATGYFVNNAGKQIAWSLRLDPDLSLNWQREYSRGLLAKLKASYSYLDDYVLAFGDVNPANGNSTGTWLALLDVADGRVLWQRYYYGEGETHRHEAHGLFVNEDNLIVLMMAAESIKLRQPEVKDDNALLADYVDYTHLLTLSPRGILLGGDTYFFGQGARVEQLVQGDDGTRIMAGYVLVKGQKEKVKDDDESLFSEPLQEEGRVFLPNVELSSKAKKGLELLQKKIDAQAVLGKSKLAKREGGLLQKGWVVVGDKLDTYKDPCSL